MLDNKKVHDMNNDLPLIKPKDIELKDLDGNVINFRISRLDAISGREIISQYPTTATAVAVKGPDGYKANEDVMFRMLKFAEVKVGGEFVRLSTKDIIINHIPDFEVLMKLEAEILKYNTGFFKIGKISRNLDGFAVNIKQLVTQILTQSLASSSEKNKPASKS